MKGYPAVKSLSKKAYTRFLIVAVAVTISTSFGSASKKNVAASPSIDTAMSVEDAMRMVASVHASVEGAYPMKLSRLQATILPPSGTWIYLFSEMPYVEVQKRRGGGLWACYREGRRDRYGFPYFPLPLSKDNAESFVAALNRLIWEKSPEAREKRNNDFEVAAVAWRGAATKPTMPQTVHEHEVLAKNAVEEKNFDKAIDEYIAGLDIFPTWPEGQFNVALICGETGDFDCAVEHMQDYLELVPNAPNAQAAKDKLIIWKDKLGSNLP